MTDEPHQDAPPEKADDDEATDPADAWPIWGRAFVEAMRRVPNFSRAAEVAGVDRSTATRLRQRDESFALAVDRARDEALDRLEEVIFARATSGLPVRKTVTKTIPRLNAQGEKVGEIVETTETEEQHVSDTLAMFYLKRWRPEYREAYRVEQTGAGGGPIRHEVEVVEQAVEEFANELERLAGT